MATNPQSTSSKTIWIREMLANGWLLGQPDKYNRELTLYEDNVVGFVKETQDEQWQKFCGLYPN